MGIADFRLTKADIGYHSEKLSRPECILAEADGTLWCSDNRGGVTRLAPDGSRQLIGSIPGAPNGLAFEADGSLLIANMRDDRLYRLRRDGSHEIVLDSFAGKPLGAVNFVLGDGTGDRFWITISTHMKPPPDAIKKPTPDGAILMLEHGKATLAADGLHFTNEVRIDRARKFLYAVESAFGRILRFPLAADGTLGERQVFGPAPLFPGAVIDGIAFDGDGNLWATEVERNGIYIFAPDGSCHCVFEDPDKEVWDFPTSLTFAGPDLRTVYVGSINMDRLAVFRSPVAGEPMPHWHAAAGSAA